MPRLSKEINPFDGGLNNYSDPRDIEDNELVVATNVNTSNSGRITVGDDFDDTGGEETFLTPFRARGLFRFNSDYNLSNALGDTEFEMMADTTGEIFRKVSGTTSWTSVLDMNSAGGSGDNSYYVADGGVRISDRTFATELQYAGISKRRVLGSGSDTIDFVTGNAAIEEPDTGKFLFDPSTPKTETITDGTINLELQRMTSSQSTVTDFNDASSSNFKEDGIETKHGYPDYGDDHFDDWGGSGVGYVNSSAVGASGRFSNITDANEEGENIQPNHDGTGTDKFLSIVKKNASGSDDYMRATIRLASGKEQDFTDKSFYFDIWVPGDVLAEMQTTGLTIAIGNYMKSSNVTDNSAHCWDFIIPVADISANEWTEIECAYGGHDDVRGSPNPTSVDTFFFQFNFNTDNLDWTNIDDTTFCLDTIKIGEPTRGLWNGYYRWYYSWIYDTKQESKTFQLANQTSPIIIENKIVQAKVQAKEHSNGFKNGGSSYSKRITGANIYYAEFDLDDNPIDSDKKLFMIADFERGVKKPADESYSSWDTTNNGGGENNAKTQSVYTVYFDTPLIDTFQTTAGYIEDDKISKIQGKTATVMNRRAYIANVKLTEDTGQEKEYSDRIYKSEPNMFDVFTDLSYIDVAINDGDTNTALIGFGDFLLQFKSRTMYLINVTQDIEYLEGSYEFRGVWGEAAVCKIPQGIAWVNDYGVFLFNGNEVIDLLGKKIDRIHWQTFVGIDPMIAYRPITQDIIIANQGSSGRIYLYNMITESWTTHAGSGLSGSNFSGYGTNMVTLNDGTVKMYANVGGSALRPYIWTTVAEDKTIEVVTKDQTLGDPAQRKTLKKIYITHKGLSSYAPTVEYISNNDGVLRGVNETLQASSTMRTDSFTPDNATEANNKYSYQVSIKGLCDKEFVINDISLVYRDKTLK